MCPAWFLTVYNTSHPEWLLTDLGQLQLEGMALLLSFLFFVSGFLQLPLQSLHLSLELPLKLPHLSLGKPATTYSDQAVDSH